jgi:hypothetical protein
MTKITTEHLARSAYVYIRQSTADQLMHNHESRHRIVPASGTHFLFTRALPTLA